MASDPKLDNLGSVWQLHTHKKPSLHLNLPFMVIVRPHLVLGFSLACVASKQWGATICRYVVLIPIFKGALLIKPPSKPFCHSPKSERHYPVLN